MALRLSSSVLRSTSRHFSSAAVATGGLDRMHSVENFEKVLDKFAEIRACAVLRTATSEACPKAMQAAIDGGFKIVEFTLTTPNCLDHLSDFRQKYDGDVMVGCGTILSPKDAEDAIDAGAEFIITPVMLPDVIEWCKERNIVCVPGCQTPTGRFRAVVSCDGPRILWQGPFGCVCHSVSRSSFQSLLAQNSSMLTDVVLLCKSSFPESLEVPLGSRP